MRQLQGSRPEPATRVAGADAVGEGDAIPVEAASGVLVSVAGGVADAVGEGVAVGLVVGVDVVVEGAVKVDVGVKVAVAVGDGVGVPSRDPSLRVK